MTERDKAAEFLQTQIENERKQRETAETQLDEVRRQMQALIQEFTDATDEETPEKIRKNIRGRIALSLETLDQLMLHGSDSLKASISKFFITQGLAPTESENVGSELEKLLNKLGVND